MSKRHLLLACLIAISTCVFSQENDTLAKKKKKEKTLPENIESFPKNFLVRPRFVYPLLSINVTSRLFGNGQKLIYLPAMPGVVGLSLKIKKVYISAAIQLPARETFKNKYGKSEFRNINVHFQKRIVSWGFFYRDYKGFYLNNYKNFYPDWNVDSIGYPRTNKLRVIDAGINLNVNFNKHFSMNAAFTQGERQKKSAGSFLMGITGRFQRIDADTNFVPLSQAARYPNLNRLEYGNFASLVVSLGAGHQFVYRKFHITPVVMVGSGLQLQNYRTHRFHLRFNLPTYASAKGQIGYNGDHFFTNLVGGAEFNSIPLVESRVRLFYYLVEYGIGYRF